jgi:hypothetical protein
MLIRVTRMIAIDVSDPHEIIEPGYICIYQSRHR